MAAQRKYPDELRERATRLAVEARKDPATKPGALARIGGQLGINPETLRNWVNQAEIDAGSRPGTTTTDAEPLTELEREVRELGVHLADAVDAVVLGAYSGDLDLQRLIGDRPCRGRPSARWRSSRSASAFFAEIPCPCTRARRGAATRAR